MPNIQSAIRRTKRTKTQTIVNRLRKSKYKSAVKQMTSYITAGKMKEAKKFLPKFHSQLMKVAKTGSINRRTASRKISRVARAIENTKK
jgi:small subunit ribosomal protein S20